MIGAIIFHKNAMPDFLRRKPACATIDRKVLGAFNGNFSGDLRSFNRIIFSGSTASQANDRTACHRVPDKLGRAKWIRSEVIILNLLKTDIILNSFRPRRSLLHLRKTLLFFKNCIPLYSKWNQNWKMLWKGWTSVGVSELSGSIRLYGYHILSYVALLSLPMLSPQRLGIGILPIIC